MGLHPYCVLPAAHAPPAALRGVDGAGVEAVVLEDLVMWVSALPAPPPAAVAAARAHHDVIATALTVATPVPLRFGQWLPDEAALRAVSAERIAGWRSALRSLAGTVEYGVRVLDPRLSAAARDVRPGPGVSGRAYLEALAGRDAERARRTAAGTDVAADLDVQLGALVRQSRTEPLATAHGLVSVAHLVARGDEAAYRAALARASARFTDLRLLTSGPWPPYSFVA